MSAARIIWEELVTDELLLELQAAAGVASAPALASLRAPVAAILAAAGGLPGVDEPWSAAEAATRVRRYLAEGLLHAQSRLPLTPRFGAYTTRPPKHAPLERALAFRRPVESNSASPEELEALPVIGPVLAERIVAERRRGGPFADFDDLARRVEGIGPASVEGLRGHVAFGHPLESLPPVTRSWDLATLIGDWVRRVPGASPEERLRGVLERVAVSCAERPHPATVQHLPRRAPRTFLGSVHETDWIGVLWSGEYHKELPELLAGAASAIRVALFHAALPEPEHPTRELLDALVAARQRGVDVRVLLDADRPTDPYRSTVINEAAREYLTGHGVDVRYDAPEGLLHSKFLVLDGHTVVVGSHNWSAGSYFVFDDASLVLRSQTLAAAWGAAFDALWP